MDSKIELTRLFIGGDFANLLSKLPSSLHVATRAVSLLFFTLTATFALIFLIEFPLQDLFCQPHIGLSAGGFWLVNYARDAVGRGFGEADIAWN